MSLTGLAFIFHFIPAFLLVYYIVPIKKRGLVLFLGSLIFYSLGSPISLLVLVLLVLLNYFYANRIYKHSISEDEPLPTPDKIAKLWLIVAIATDVGVLFAFKYLRVILEAFGVPFITKLVSIAEISNILGAFTQRLVIPLGISFIIFQLLSFVIDMYRGKYAEGVSLYHFAIYATMFPQISSGPITRYSDICENIERPNYVNPKLLEEGIIYFVLGLSYKVLLADKIAALWNDVWRVGASGIDTASAWLGAWGYSFEIYFDFFGYSMMAMGVAMLLGYRLPVNFTEPYSQKTMTSFWRNWHITLGRWFRDYLYIPMGGNRGSGLRTIFNIFIVWMFTAIWHGASINFLFWGLFLFAVIFTEKYITGKWLEKTKVLGHIYMLLLIPVSWMIFNITNPILLKEYLMRMLGLPVEGMVISGLAKFYSLCETYWWLMLICILFATPYPMKFIKKYQGKFLVKLMLFVAFWYSIYQLAISGNNPFIYFSF